MTEERVSGFEDTMKIFNLNNREKKHWGEKRIEPQRTVGKYEKNL